MLTPSTATPFLHKSLVLDLLDMVNLAAQPAGDINAALEQMRVRPMNWAPLSLALIASPADNAADNDADNNADMDKDTNGVQAVLFNYGADLVVSFAYFGHMSPDVLQSMTSFKELPSSNTNFHVATRAYELWQGAHTPVTEFITNWTNNNPDATVYMCGHGMGAAAATLQAAYTRSVLDLAPERLVHVAFGSFRLGTRAFAREFARQVPQSYRVINGHDMVATLSMATVVGVPKGLHHVGAHVMHFRNESALHLYFYNPVRQLLLDTFSMDDHHIGAYWKAVAEWDGLLHDTV